jgi:predicted ATPase
VVAYKATGAQLGRPFQLTQLAEVYGKAGRAEEGRGVVDEALADVERTGECVWEAELYQIKGELLVSSADNDAEAEAYFQHALATARRQQAKSLELRAAMSLARLWQRQDKRTEAHRLLTGIYGWFTEGFDTADLQEAKALLEKLA